MLEKFQPMVDMFVFCAESTYWSRFRLIDFVLFFEQSYINRIFWIQKVLHM